MIAQNRIIIQSSIIIQSIVMVVIIYETRLYDSDYFTWILRTWLELIKWKLGCTKRLSGRCKSPSEPPFLGKSHGKKNWNLTIYCWIFKLIRNYPQKTLQTYCFQVKNSLMAQIYENTDNFTKISTYRYRYVQICTWNRYQSLFSTT